DDGHALNSFGYPTSDGGAWWPVGLNESETKTMSDAPFLSVADTSQSMSVTDSFETHLMYIAVPDEFSTVWISLARADWAYSASWAKPWPFKLPIAQHVALFSPING